MKLEDQCCSLDLAKSLKELGVKQESLFWWVNLFWWVKWNGERHKNGPEGWHLERYPHEDCECISAFTVAELGEMLPGMLPGITKDGMYFVYQWGLMHNRAYATIKRTSDETKVAEFEEKTEADARAKMLVYLLENKLLTV